MIQKYTEGNVLYVLELLLPPICLNSSLTQFTTITETMCITVFVAFCSSYETAYIWWLLQTVHMSHRWQRTKWLLTTVYPSQVITTAIRLYLYVLRRR